MGRFVADVWRFRSDRFNLSQLDTFFPAIVGEYEKDPLDLRASGRQHVSHEKQERFRNLRFLKERVHLRIVRGELMPALPRPPPRPSYMKLKAEVTRFPENANFPDELISRAVFMALHSDVRILDADGFASRLKRRMDDRADGAVGHRIEVRDLAQNFQRFIQFLDHMPQNGLELLTRFAQNSAPNRHIQPPDAANVADRRSCVKKILKIFCPHSATSFTQPAPFQCSAQSRQCRSLHIPLAAAALAASSFAPPPAGKTRLPCFGAAHLRPATALTCALGRNYARPEARAAVERAAARVAETHPGVRVTFLDAGTRGGGRLWPHRTHGSGGEIDLALFFESLDGAPRARPPRWLGYGAYEPRGATEPDPCTGAKRPADFGDPPAHRRWRLDEARTTALIAALVDDDAVTRVFLAPHLAARLDVAGHPKVRFAGCHAARHDDHVHVGVGERG